MAVTAKLAIPSNTYKSPEDSIDRRMHSYLDWYRIYTPIAAGGGIDKK
jgi:hypothetical protein